jgi:sulfur-oxidizing protein SoxY
MLAGAALGVVGLRPSAAASEDLKAAVLGFTGGKPPRDGRVHLDISPLVENGNTVPLSVSVDSPMTPADHVSAIAVFNERNPQRDVAVFHLTPRSGRASVSTRIRLATSQQLVAVARMSDGSHWAAQADVIVTLAGCIEGS